MKRIDSEKERKKWEHDLSISGFSNGVNLRGCATNYTLPV